MRAFTYSATSVYPSSFARASRFLYSSGDQLKEVRIYFLEGCFLDMGERYKDQGAGGKEKEAPGIRLSGLAVQALGRPVADGIQWLS